MGGEISAAAGLGNAVIGVLWDLIEGTCAIVLAVLFFCALIKFLSWRLSRKRHAQTQPSPVIGVAAERRAPRRMAHRDDEVAVDGMKTELLRILDEGDRRG